MNDKQLTLRISTHLFKAMNENMIQYCHWKSNQHLTEALAGLTDLDLLVDSKQKASCHDLLSELGFIRVESLPGPQYLGIEDWLGFDYDTGNLIHVHLHFKLLLGAKGIKNHHLPLERWLLDNSRTQEGVKVPEHECELMLLIIRTVLKFDGKFFLGY